MNQSGSLIIKQEPSNIVRRNVSPDVGDDKVIALTFDDGPWGDQTGQVLDVLAEHGAKATFFTVGNRIEQDNGDAFVKRAVSEGHQVCTHSYDHAAGSGQGVNLGFMSPEEQKAEVEKGRAAIEAVTGAEASRIFRTPGGNFGDDVVKNIGPLIKAEIGWNIDSSDWRRPGADAIAKQIEDAWPGAIVLMHDGGGDRSQTIEALKKAPPPPEGPGLPLHHHRRAPPVPLVVAAGAELAHRTSSRVSPTARRGRRHAQGDFALSLAPRYWYSEVIWPLDCFEQAGGGVDIVQPGSQGELAWT